MGKIIVAGDSIAYGKWDSEGGWVTRLRKYIDENYNVGKNGNFQVYNLGIPGEVAPRLAERFENELRYRIDTAEKNLVLIAIGVNDSCPNNKMSGKRTAENEFKEALQNMIDVSLKHGCKVVFVGLSPVNPARSKGLLFTNEEVRTYDRYISEVCDKNQVVKLDLFDELLKVNFPELLVDSVHPNSEGHKLLFEKVVEFLDNEKIIEYYLI